MDEAFKDFQDVKTYLALLEESNRALEYLIGHFKESSTPVIICFFGDHQPGCLNPDFEKQMFLPDGNETHLELLQRKQEVPYFIWSNITSSSFTPTGEQSSSPNFLGSKLLEYAGLPLPPYNSFLNSLGQTIPVINQYGYQDAHGQWHEFEPAVREQDWFKNYQILHYYSLYPTTD